MQLGLDPTRRRQRRLRPIDGRDVARVEFIQTRHYLFLAHQWRTGQRRMQHRHVKGAARALRHRRKTEVPRFGLHAGQNAAVRAEKTEAGGVRVQPIRQRRVWPPG